GDRRWGSSHPMIMSHCFARLPPRLQSPRGGEAMRLRLTVTAVVFLGVLASAPAARAQGGGAAAARLFASSADVKAMIARAKAERKPDQPNFSQPIVSLAPYNANLEYRVGSLSAPASTHDKDAEL